MNDSQIARLLFFTRAAVEADPELAGARIGSPAMSWLGRAWTTTPEDEKNWPPCTDITAPLSIAGIYRLWDDPESAGHCRCCGSRMLFLRLKGRYSPDCHGFHSGYCPFCDTDNTGRPTEIGPATFSAVRRVVEKIATADAATPQGMPFNEAVARLMVLRDADLLDPAHPLEVASMKCAQATPPVLGGHPARECEEARMRAAIAPRELATRLAAVRDEALDRLFREPATASDAPDAEEFDMKPRMAQIDDAAVAAAEAEFGRSLSKRERAVFIRALDDVSALR
jgi:hypothetical protein